MEDDEGEPLDHDEDGDEDDDAAEDELPPLVVVLVVVAPGGGTEAASGSRRANTGGGRDRMGTNASVGCKRNRHTAAVKQHEETIVEAVVIILLIGFDSVVNVMDLFSDPSQYLLPSELNQYILLRALAHSM